MTPSLVTALYILRAIIGVFLPVLALAGQGRPSAPTKQGSR